MGGWLGASPANLACAREGAGPHTNAPASRPTSLIPTRQISRPRQAAPRPQPLAKQVLTGLLPVLCPHKGAGRLLPRRRGARGGSVMDGASHSSLAVAEQALRTREAVR
eukprot:scaffold104_cov375-Prasinococcus_capsulatus_cf.AAC.1